MKQEEKAKAYDKAIKVIKDNLDALNEITEIGAEVVNIQSIKNCFYRAFPELKESEDEKIRKWLISQLKIKSDGTNSDLNIMIDKSIDWLEKQSEQKSVEWSEVDKVRLEEAIQMIEFNGTCKLVSDWLKSLKDRGLPQQKQEWSEEDENLLKLSFENLTELKDMYGEEYGKVGDCISWLKSLKERYTWRPSDE